MVNEIKEIQDLKLKYELFDVVNAGFWNKEDWALSLDCQECSFVGPRFESIIKLVRVKVAKETVKY